MKENELITVVVPVRNRESLVGRCLDSIAAQNYRPLRIIVTDNGSTDGTLLRVEEWRRANDGAGLRTEIFVEPLPGAARARDRGFREVEGENAIVLFFDSDDEMLPGLIEKAAEAFRTGPSVDMVCWRRGIWRGDVKERVSLFSTEEPLRYHLLHAQLSTQSYAVRSGFLRKCGGWKGEVTCWNDWELGIRLMLGSPEMVFIDEELVRVNHQSDSITGDDFASKAGRWEFALDCGERAVRESGNPRSREIADTVDYQRVILAAHYRHEGRPDLAAPLLRQALSRHGFRRRLLFRLIYHYTARGGRGAWRLWREPKGL